MTTKKTLQQVAAYFRDCYQTDFRAIHLLNFFSKKVAKPLVYELPELLTGKLIQTPAPTKWGEKIYADLAIYAKEKSLLCGAFFLSGRTMMIGKSQRVFAPLYLYNIDIFEEDEIYYLSLDAENPMINPAFFDCLKSEAKDESVTLDYLQDKLPTGYLKFEQIHEISEILKDCFPNLNLENLELFPKMSTADELEKLRKSRKKTTQYSLLSAICIGLVNKSSGSRGVLNELEMMSSYNYFSKPLEALFTNEKMPKKTKKKLNFLAPVTLSKNQEAIIQSAENNVLTMAIGPPGTGKSFTIAALAVDFLSQQKSVLIAARNNQAVNVVADKIEQDFGIKDVVVRAGKDDYRQFLKNRLNNLLHGFGLQGFRYTEYLHAKKNVKQLIARLKDLENEIADRELEELQHGDFLAFYKNSFFQRIKRYFTEKTIRKNRPFWELLFEYEKKTEERHRTVRSWNEFNFQYHLIKGLDYSRGQFQNFLSGLKKRQGTLRDEIFSQVNFQKILSAFPIWIVNTADIDRVLPMYKELFDLVIIDEASQCDIASALPVLQRGSKAVIVGDPKQLRHLSFLPINQQRILQEKHALENLSEAQLNYRNHSILDVVAATIKSQEQVYFLDEHYRSMPDIIAFSNQHFYGNHLKIMTETPTTKDEKSVFIHQVDGQRTTKGINEKEAETIIKKIRQLVDFEADLHPKFCQSIGILSPFREQVNYLQTQIQEKFSIAEIEKHRMLIGTPHAFQGEEKDVMLISFAVDEAAHPSTFQYLNREDVFNVSITRARSVQHLFLSRSTASLSPKYLLTKYLESIEKPILKRVEKSELSGLDSFMEEVEDQLKQWNISQVKKAYHIAGLEIDMVVIHDGKTYCIDLVGYPGDFEYAIPLHRWKLLSRLGIRVFALPFSLWSLERNQCEQALRQFLDIS